MVESPILEELETRGSEAELLLALLDKRACPGFRVQTKVMDQALLDHLVEELNGERIREALVAYRG